MALSHLHLTHLNRLSLAFQLGNFHVKLSSWGEVGREWWQRYGWHNQLHMHSFFEVTYVHKGQGCFHVHDQEHALQPGALFVARPTELHEIHSSQESPLEISFWSYSLTLSQSRAALDPQGIDMLLETFLSSPCWVKSGSEEIEATLQVLAAKVTQRAPGYLVAIEGLLTKLLLDSVRAVTPLAWQALDASEYDECFAPRDAQRTARQEERKTTLELSFSSKSMSENPPLVELPCLHCPAYVLTPDDLPALEVYEQQILERIEIGKQAEKPR